MCFEILSCGLASSLQYAGSEASLVGDCWRRALDFLIRITAVTWNVRNYKYFCVCVPMILTVKYFVFLLGNRPCKV